MRFNVSHSDSEPFATVSLEDGYVLITLVDGDFGAILENDHEDGDGYGYLHHYARGLHKDNVLVWLASRDTSMECVAEGRSLAYAIGDLASQMAS